MPNEKYTLNYTAAQVDGAIGKAISIEANPTLVGTEDALTGLQVGDTKYKVDSGISQADADARYLKLTGGTMSGDIKLSAYSLIDANNKNILNAASTGTITLGNSNYNNNLIIRTNSGNEIIHQTSDGNAVILSTRNTQANPTLAGTETALTSLKLNGTNYAIAGGTQVTFVDWS